MTEPAFRGRDDIYTPPGGPPQGPRPSPEIYEQMGQPAIEKMCEDFYQRLGQSEIRHLFHGDLVEASRRQALFLVGILGGPPLYMEAYGHPRMRARHFPFAIDESARRAWLYAFDQVLEHAPERYGFPAEHLSAFRVWLDEFSAWIVNVAPPSEHFP